MNISTEKKKRTFYINKEILAKLDVISESKGIQKSKLVEEALQQFYNNMILTTHHILITKEKDTMFIVRTSILLGFTYMTDKIKVMCIFTIKIKTVYYECT